MSYTMWPKVYGQYNYLFHFQFILKVLDGVEMQASQVFPFQTGEIISSWPWFTCIVMLQPQIESTQEYIEKCVHILLAMQCNNLRMSKLLLSDLILCHICVYLHAFKKNVSLSTNPLCDFWIYKYTVSSILCVDNCIQQLCWKRHILLNSVTTVFNIIMHHVTFCRYDISLCHQSFSSPNCAV